ncbi:MAG: DUF2975 domain-containing protein [Clostridiales bacterium]|nr:DUF2975 domain-containing protein [Clostridiales bacterium]
MEQTSVQKLARVLRVLVIITIVCNLIALLMVPMLSCMYGVMTAGEIAGWGIDGLSYLFGLESTPRDYFPFTMMFFYSWLVVWADAYTAVLTVFLWVCGICTAFILWQGKRVLDTILKGEPFTLSNAVSLKRAAVCCFVISGAALVRTVWGLVYYQSIAPLFTYNALFVPIFLMAGLLCMVMSALFRQAAELKAENDLTI